MPEGISPRISASTVEREGRRDLTLRIQPRDIAEVRTSPPCLL